MKSSFFNFLLLASLLIVVGCGSQGKTVNLNVTGSFSISAAGYTGGLIAYGEGPNGARFSTSSADGSSTLTTTIDDGAWKIYVVGWESTTNPTQKFRGTKYCGMTAVNLALADTNINIDVSAANCNSSAFLSETGMHEVLISSCGAFYNYDNTANTFSPLTAASPDSFCNNLPDGQNYAHPVYRLVSNNIQGKTLSPGISSDCISTSTAASNRLSLPTKKIPFTVHTYSSMIDCQQLPVQQSEKFFFPQGLEAGNSVSFDHHFMATAVPNARLILPSASTRRGTSPFMNLLPRILCTNGDCFTAPVTPLMAGLTGNAKIEVSWDSYQVEDRVPTLARNVKPSNFSSEVCAPTVISQLNSSQDFSVTDCFIEDGHLKGSLTKNIFQCKNSTAMPGIIDMHEKNNFIYLMNSFGGNSYKISAHTQKGLRVHEVQLGALTSPVYRSMSVDSSRNIYLLIDVTGTTNLIYIGYNPATKTYNTPAFFSPSHLQGATHIAVSDTGNIVTATPGSANQLEAYTLPTIASTPVPTTLEESPNADVRKLLFHGGNLWVLTNANANTYIYDYSVTGNIITWAHNAARYSQVGSYENFHIADTLSGRLMVLINSAAAPIKMMNLSAANVLTSNLSTSATLPTGQNILYADSKIYALTGTPAVKAFSLYNHDSIGNTITLVPDRDVCQAQLNAVIDGVTYPVNVEARRTDTLKVVFEDSFRFFGIRKVLSQESPSYFRSLQGGDRDDHGRAEGVLRRASEMMGPDGVGGVIGSLYPAKTCAEIKTLITTGGSVTKNFTLNDSLNQQSKTYTVSLGVSSTPFPDFLCTTAGCSTPFDLLMLIRIPGEEATELKISCTQKLGSIESADLRDNEVRHDLTLWNTQDLNSMRYENYEVEDRFEGSVNKKRITLTKLQKTADNAVDVRSLELNRDPASIQGRITELALTSGAEKITSSSIDTGYISPVNFNISNTVTLNNGKSVSSIIQNDKFGSVFIPQATKCMQQVTADTLLPSIASCPSPVHGITVSSKDPGLLFRLDSLESFTSGANPPIYSIFTLNP